MLKFTDLHQNYPEKFESKDRKTNFNEIKDKSATTKFGNSLLLDKRSLGFKYRILVRSKSMTFGLFLIFHAVCP